MENKIAIIPKSDIEEALHNSDREYLVGNLSKKQNLRHIFDKDVEIGISDYQKETIDKPHFHTCISEYQYILKGEIILFDIDNRKSYQLSEGDFYAVPKGNLHVQISKENSRILFVKNKSINDKKVITVSEEVHQWIKNVLKESVK